VKNLDVLAAIEKLAQEKGRTPAQLALAWLLARAPHVVPIPGTRSVERLEENVAAVDVPLSDEELDAIEKVAPKGFAAGTRSPEQAMASLDG
jgi:aryl-alcohol dehydrogenase-like predicted oxidoreductase